MSVLPMRKWAQELQAAPLCAGKAGAEVSFSGSSPLPQGSRLPHARSPPITWCREVSGDSFRVTGSVGHPRAKMSWRHHWGWGRVVGAWASLLLPGLPLSNHLSHGSAGPSLHNPADPRPLLTPNTSTHLVSWCPGGWLSLESLYQVGPSHRTHQDLRVWTSGERGRGEGAGEERRGGKGRGAGEGCIMKIELAFLLFPGTCNSLWVRKLRLRGIEKLIALPKVLRLLLWWRGSQGCPGGQEGVC